MISLRKYSNFVNEVFTMQDLIIRNLAIMAYRRIQFQMAYNDPYISVPVCFLSHCCQLINHDFFCSFSVSIFTLKGSWGWYLGQPWWTLVSDHIIICGKYVLLLPAIFLLSPNQRPYIHCLECI